MSSRTLIWSAAVVSIAVGAFVVAMPMSRAGSLESCGRHEAPSELNECVYAFLKETLTNEGISPALREFMHANNLFPGKLEADCHSAIHKLGDMMYYDVFTAEPFLDAYTFPEESMVCNRGFYHGFFEHLIQEKPEAQFIVDTCNYFKAQSEPYMAFIASTCFHAAGHGLFRAQAERVPREEWGDARAFVREPVETCRELPGASEAEKYSCTTGVESIYIQMNNYGNYGFSDRGDATTLSVCDRLDDELHSTCYYVRSLMVAQLDDDHERLLLHCAAADDGLFDRCVNGVVTGLFVNGVNPASFERTMDLCSDGRVIERGFAEACYQYVGRQLKAEYRDDVALTCDAFPPEHRHYCPWSV